MTDPEEQLLDITLEEMLGGKNPPDVTSKVLSSVGKSQIHALNVLAEKPPIISSPTGHFPDRRVIYILAAVVLACLVLGIYWFSRGGDKTGQGKKDVTVA
ncbi:hypothetical protein ACFL54_06415, partial [Planctomycetota bacterium]